MENDKMASERLQGIVKWFSKRKGFGFITGENKKDYFVHYTQIQKDTEILYLNEGECVEFTPEADPKGEQAINVVPVKLNLEELYPIRNTL